MNDLDLAAIVDLTQETMYLRDPGVIYLTLGAVAANRLPGDPVWLLLVGPPSSGKSEALGALSELPEYHAVSTFTEAGLLSGSSTKAGGKGHGGLLAQFSPCPCGCGGKRGLMGASDFGTLLNEHGSTRNRLFACLREVFDGKFVRHLGTDGGRTFAWSGHAAFVGACTDAIDGPGIDLGLLGERLCYYRIPAVSPDDENRACEMADANAGHQRVIRAHRAAAVRDFFASLALPSNVPTLTGAEQEQLVTLAHLGSRCRSSVVRDGYSREIELVPSHERSPRLFGQLRQLHAGLVVIGTPYDETWRLLASVALDGIHPGRRAVLEFLVARPAAHPTASIAGHCRLTVTPTRRYLQDLTAHGVLDLVPGTPELWVASTWLLERWPTEPRAMPHPDEPSELNEPGDRSRVGSYSPATLDIERRSV